MDPFVRRLIQRLHDPAQPLSRNRHFHTFDTPEGRRALKTSRRLKSLQRDIVACHREGGQVGYSRKAEDDGTFRVELALHRIRGRRTAMLEAAEFELLIELAGVSEALKEIAA
jgi:hypothetical protein